MGDGGGGRVERPLSFSVPPPTRTRRAGRARSGSRDPEVTAAERPARGLARHGARVELEEARDLRALEGEGGREGARRRGPASYPRPDDDELEAGKAGEARAPRASANAGPTRSTHGTASTRTCARHLCARARAREREDDERAPARERGRRRGGGGDAGSASRATERERRAGARAIASRAACARVRRARPPPSARSTRAKVAKRTTQLGLARAALAPSTPTSVQSSSYWRITLRIVRAARCGRCRRRRRKSTASAAPSAAAPRRSPRAPRPRRRPAAAAAARRRGAPRRSRRRCTARRCTARGSPTSPGPQKIAEAVVLAPRVELLEQRPRRGRVVLVLADHGERPRRRLLRPRPSAVRSGAHRPRAAPAAGGSTIHAAQRAGNAHAQHATPIKRAPACLLSRFRAPRCARARGRRRTHDSDSFSFQGVTTSVFFFLMWANVENDDSHHVRRASARVCLRLRAVRAPLAARGSLEARGAPRARPSMAATIRAPAAAAATDGQSTARTTLLEHPAVFAFGGGDGADGARSLAWLLGGKGANLSEMARIGLERASRLHDHDRGVRGVPRRDGRDARARRLGERPRRARPARGEDGREARRSARAAAALGPLGRRGLDAGHDGHGAQPRHDRRRRGRARRQDGQRALRVRQLPALPRPVRLGRRRRARTARSRPSSTRSSSRGAFDDAELGADDLEALVARYKGVYDAHGATFPQDAREQLRQSVAAVFASWRSELDARSRARAARDRATTSSRGRG